jgi:type I restriction-modification system DNA methylase subunit
MQNITQLENDLWESADQLRANSRLNQTQYSNPVLGLIFLWHALVPKICKRLFAVSIYERL